MIVLRLSHSDRRFSSSSMIGVVARLAEQPAREADGVPDALEGFGRKLLRNKADPLARIADNPICQFLPSTSTSPPLGVTIPQTMLISVVLPAPFGPSSAKISPRRMSRSTDLSASTPVP